MSNHREIERIKKDISYFYHEQADWDTGALYADLSFGRTYNLPYWSYVWFSSETLLPEDVEFIRRGSLMIIFTMCLDTIEGSGHYFVAEGLEEVCRREINSGQTTDPNTLRLIAAVNLAMDMVQNSARDNQEISDLSVWARETFVGGYFLKMARGFNNAN